MFNVLTTRGSASIILSDYCDAPRGFRVEAAVTSGNTIGALEMEVHSVRASEPDHLMHGQPMLNITTTPGGLLSIATAILAALDLPAFNSREWYMIATALRGQATLLSPGESRNDLIAKAVAIETSADKINAITSN